MSQSLIIAHHQILVSTYFAHLRALSPPFAFSLSLAQRSLSFRSTLSRWRRSAHANSLTLVRVQASWQYALGVAICWHRKKCRVRYVRMCVSQLVGVASWFGAPGCKISDKLLEKRAIIAIIMECWASSAADWVCVRVWVGVWVWVWGLGFGLPRLHNQLGRRLCLCLLRLAWHIIRAAIKEAVSWLALTDIHDSRAWNSS